MTTLFEYIRDVPLTLGPSMNITVFVVVQLFKNLIRLMLHLWIHRHIFCFFLKNINLMIIKVQKFLKNKGIMKNIVDRYYDFYLN